MIAECLFSSGKNDWATPIELFKELDREFLFTIDVCASENNHKVETYYSEEQNALLQEWKGSCWCNPPYSRNLQRQFIKKAFESKCLVVMLLPARTDTKAFHQFIYKNPKAEIRFLKGRIQFEGAKQKAPFPSMIVIFRNME